MEGLLQSHIIRGCTTSLIWKCMAPPHPARTPADIQLWVERQLGPHFSRFSSSNSGHFGQTTQQVLLEAPPGAGRLPGEVLDELSSDGESRSDCKEATSPSLDLHSLTPVAMLQVHIQAWEANLWALEQPHALMRGTVDGDRRRPCPLVLCYSTTHRGVDYIVSQRSSVRSLTVDCFLTPLHGAATDEDSVSLTSLCKRVPVCGAGNLGTQPALSGHCLQDSRFYRQPHQKRCPCWFPPPQLHSPLSGLGKPALNSKKASAVFKPFTLANTVRVSRGWSTLARRVRVLFG
ncbi:hypothetical protein CDEST_09444 [Colletotrichum destructivum]|uniref:Uncharacterized protein n=1 Tax=Colletotrichum destructivum TaxID=34406 RepID=A0AAX4ILT2_9PEZI|nr:hypothetical protein CDEST_09444 [Colletotrichum destructivum]